MEKKKRWIIQIVIFICFIMLGRQIIGSKAMISEMIDGYYQGVFGGFCPVLLKKEETIKETILSDMIRIYYREAVPFLQYRTDYKDKKGQDLVQEDYYHFQDDETTDEVAQEVKKEAKIFHAKKWENPKYLRKYIYQIDSTTMAMDGELNGKVLLNMDLKLKKSEKPQILIYHTHGSETYRGSKKGKKSDTVIGVGDVLVKNLRKKNIAVIHDRNIYDVKNGKEERSKAYNYAANAIEDHLKKYPSIKVVIDLHRDGVSEQTKLVTTQKGRRMAQIMFFNGLSKKASGNISYLQNKNLQGNLSFSLQLKLVCMRRFQNLAKPIYLKGYRYNMHLKERFTLIELGNENNTLQEEINATKPLAMILDCVLQGKK